MMSLHHGNRFERNRNPWRSLTKQDHNSPILSEERQDRSHQAKTAAIHQESKIASKKKAPKDVIKARGSITSEASIEQQSQQIYIGRIEPKAAAPDIFFLSRTPFCRLTKRNVNGYLGSTHKKYDKRDESSWDIKNHEKQRNQPRRISRAKYTDDAKKKKKVARPDAQATVHSAFGQKEHEVNTQNSRADGSTNASRWKRTRTILSSNRRTRGSRRHGADATSTGATPVGSANTQPREQCSDNNFPDAKRTQ